MIIGVIGLGYVGLTLSIAAASKGIEVYGLEINPHIKDCLKKNKAHFFEKGLDELIEKYNNQTFHVVEELPKDVPFDAFIVTVGTPLANHTDKKPNFDYILSALNAIKNVYDGSQTVILRSTVSVGTTRNIVLPRLVQMSGKDSDEILLGMCPERTIEGQALLELTTLPQIISGNNRKSLKIARDLFLKITTSVVETESIEEAEIAKLYCNVYRDMTFAIGNAFCLAAQFFGVDGVKVIEHANEGYPRSRIAKPGFVAGPCLEKDAHILLNNMPSSISKDFIHTARSLNEGLEDIVCAYVKKKLGEPETGKIITVSGLAFKGRPETSDLRGSSAVNIATKLAAMGYKLYLHDFIVPKKDLEALNIGRCFKKEDLFEACRGSALLMVLNNHEKYATLAYDDSLDHKRGIRVLDIWNVCKKWHTHQNIQTDTIGTLNLD